MRFCKREKTNASGKLDYSGSVAHANPTHSLDVIKGVHYFFRWSVLREAFPVFSEPSNCCNATTLRKDTDESTPIDYQLLNDKCHLFHEVVGFMTNKSKCNKKNIKQLLTNA